MSEVEAVDRVGGAAIRPPQGVARRFALPTLRFAGVYAMLTAVMYAWGSSYAAAWCKPIEIAISMLASTFIVSGVDVANQGDQRVFILRARTRAAIHTPRGTAPAGSRLQSTTLQAYAHHHLILALAALAAWPVRGATRRAALLLAGVPAIALVTLLDVPFTLLGVAQDAILAAGDPNRPREDVAVLYFQFLQRGGRQVLSLAAAALAIILSQNHHTP